MRPDEHKKKSSSRYKKKHGLEANANDKKDSKNRQSSTKSTFDDEKSKQNELEDDSTKRSYSRRTVTSNWDRYEEPEEVVEQIGADFNELVSSAVGAASHMVLESEKHWGDDQELDEVLTIDFQKLGESLALLPFCERLGLDEAQFDPSLLQLLKDGESPTAELNSNFAPMTTFTLNKFDFQNPTKTEEKLFTNLKISENGKVQEELKNEPNDFKSSAPNPCNIESKVPEEPQHPSDAEEDVVDGLVKRDYLSVSPSGDDAVVSLKSISSEKPSTEARNLELELDSLLDGGSVSASVIEQKKLSAKEQNVSVATGHKKSSTDKEQDELEDWLDSII